MFSFVQANISAFMETALARPSKDDIDSVVGATPVGVGVSAINAIVYTLLCVDAENALFQVSWLVVTLGLCAHIYLKSLKTSGRTYSVVSRRASRRLVMFTCLFAMPWAVLSLYVLGLNGSGNDLLVLLVCAGMSTGGIFMLHRTLAAAMAYNCTILAGVVLSAHFGHHASAWPITAFTLVYGSTLTLLAVSVGETARERDQSVEALSQVVSDLEQARDDNHNLAYKDAVTGLPNRKSFNETLVSRVAHTRDTGEPFTLLFLDLDHFKNVNDVYGHAVGDKLLSLVGKRLTSAVRSTDTVARLGGDEFAIALSNINNTSEIEKICEQIIDSVTQSAEIEGIALHPATSIGAASFPNHSDNISSLMVNADLALNKAKERGRGFCIVFHESLRDQMLSNDRIETALRKAIDQHDIKVAYQPKIRLSDGKLVGAEALVRWSHHEFGPVSPDRFLTIAAERGLLPTMSRYIANRVAQDILTWRANAVDVGKIALNIHPSDLKSPEFLLELVEYLQTLGVTHKDITLEITEGCFVGRGTDKALFVLDTLSDRGFELSLDDFGTGHASLSHLKTLPVSEIKIDKSFISGLVQNANDRAIVTAIAELARGMGIRSVAEGVEEEAQRALLSEIGVLIGQGYLWSPAVEAEQLTATVSVIAQQRRKAL